MAPFVRCQIVTYRNAPGDFNVGPYIGDDVLKIRVANIDARSSGVERGAVEVKRRQIVGARRHAADFDCKIEIDRALSDGNGVLEFRRIELDGPAIARQQIESSNYAA